MAIGASTFGNLGGAVSDLFSASALRTRAQGSRIEAQEYGLSATLSRQNEQFTQTSTAIKEMQLQRNAQQQIGAQEAGVASSGFTSSGSAVDILADSASQAALTKAVAGQQGLIEEAGYEQQARSYDLMQSASTMAARADENAAFGADIGAVLRGASAVATLF